MITSPDISIIVPTYNHGHLIGRCIRSIIRQTFKNWECIIINNYSEDHTVSVIKGFADERLKLIDFRNNGVIAASRNEGIRLAKGNYLAFLDSDDWWYSEKLDIAKKYLHSADIVFHDLDIYTPKGKRGTRKFRGRRLKSPVFGELMKGGNALPNSSVIVRRSMVDKVGGFDEARRMISIEDFDLWLKISQITDRFAYIPRPLGAYWVGPQNTNELSEKKIVQIREVHDKYQYFLSADDRKQSELHMLYSIARIKQRTGDWREARRLFRMTLGSKNLRDRLKSIFFIALIRSFRSLSSRV